MEFDTNIKRKINNQKNSKIQNKYIYILLTLKDFNLFNFPLFHYFILLIYNIYT